MLFRSVCLAVLFFLSPLTSPLYADEQYSVNPSNSTIQGSVKYTVVGRYRAAFERFNGIITYDPQSRMIRSVTLDIEVNSIKSKFAALDRAVRSPALLDAKKFPHIVFKSASVERVQEGFKVKGTLEIHGVRRDVAFVFTADEPVIVNAKKVTRAKGKWRIPRREYGVIWNKMLDRGGIIVGNDITVDWQVTAQKF